MTLLHPFLQKIYNWVSQKSFVEVIKYVLVSAGGYVYVVVSMYILVDLLKMNKSFSYFAVYIFAYLFDYLLTLKYIFQKEHKNVMLVKYIAYLAAFFVINNLLYNLMVFFNVHYMVSTITTILLLFPLRFSTIKFVVFV